MTNEVATVQNFKSLLTGINVRKRFEDILGKKAAGFISSVVNIVSNDANLSKAEPLSVLNSAIIAATLDLPINQNLGFAYIVAYYSTKEKKHIAQFQMGYKGYIQLAIRTAEYEEMNVCPIYDGEITRYDRISGNITVDYDAKKSDEIIGYNAYFKTKSGFKKSLYMDIEQLEKHAKEYSQTYKKGYGKWQDNFHSMCMKTVIKLLLSKWGIMSIDMQKAVQSDQAQIKENNGDISYGYVDNEKPINKKPDVEMPKAVNKETGELSSEAEAIGAETLGA